VNRRIQAPRGTYDVLGEQALARDALEGHARTILERAGYRRIETPAFEHTELFARGVGASTDIVQKEMYTFQDAGERSLTLRPEGTAPVCRAYLEHGMFKLPQPVKLWYLSSYFRRERPPWSSKVNISLRTMSVDSPTPRSNSSVCSNAGVSIRR